MNVQLQGTVMKKAILLLVLFVSVAGLAVASRYFSVGSVVPWAMAGVGAVATQANVNVGYGQQAIDLLRQGMTAQQVLQKLMEEDKFEGKDGRQVAIVDA